MFKRLLFTFALVLSCLDLNAQSKLASGKTYINNENVVVQSASVMGDSLLWKATFYDMKTDSRGLHYRGAQSVTLTFSSAEKLLHCLEYISTAKEDAETMVRLDDTMYGNTLTFGKYTFVLGTGSDKALKETALVLGNIPKMTLKKLRKLLGVQDKNVRNPCEYEEQL